MRIPLSDNQIGCWYYITDKSCYFIPDYWPYYDKKSKDRHVSTFEAFKKEFPVYVRDSGKYRKKHK